MGILKPSCGTVGLVTVVWLATEFIVQLTVSFLSFARFEMAHQTQLSDLRGRC